MNKNFKKSYIYFSCFPGISWTINQINDQITNINTAKYMIEF